MGQTVRGKNGMEKKIDTSSPLDDEMSAIKSDLSALRDDFKSLASTLGDMAKKSGAEGFETSKELASKAGDKALEARASIEDRVRQNPMAAMAIALGFGAAIATLRRRS